MVASILGKDIKTGNLVTLDQKARLRGLYVIGKTGSGKTTLLINLILQDIEQGMGVCFFDTHGDPINAILARLPATRIVDGVERATEDDVILLDPLDKDATFGLNLFQCEQTDEEQVSRTVSYVLEAFAKLFTKEGDFSTEAPNMELTLRNAAYTLIDNLSIYGTTMAELPLLIDDEEARTNLIRNIAAIHSEPLRFWNRYNRIKQDERDRITSSAYSRVNRFLTNVFIKEVVGQSISTLNFRKIMDEKKIVLVKLSRRDRELTNLVGSIIIGQIANAAFSREDTPENQRVQFNLYADEYQRFATPTFAELLAEVRKYKIATCVAHQWRQQLDVDNRKATLNAGTMVVFEVTGEDAEELAKQFKAEPQPTEPRLEQTRTPVTEVLGWLSSSRAHPDPKVNYFMNKAFTPMVNAIKEHHNFRQGEEAQKAYEYLNQFFYKIMLDGDKVQQELRSGNPSKDALLAQEFGQTGSPDNATFFLMLDPIPIEVFFPMVKHSEYERTFPDILDMLRNTLDGEFGMVLSQKVEEYKEHAEEALAGFPKLWQDDYDRDYEIHKINHALFYLADRPLRLGDTLINREKQTNALALFVKEFKDFINGLFRSPITDASGHYEEKPGLPEPIANAQARVANELANPKKKFTAQVKLESGEEHTIEIEETEQFRHSAAPSVSLAQQLKIVDQTRLNYCKRRVDIEQEIAARQEELTRRVKPIAKARTGDDTQTPLSPAQLKKLQSIKVALGEKDYNLFFNDPLVLQRRGELLDIPEFSAGKIGIFLNDWRKAGSPSDVSPFAELIKTLLG